MELSPDQITIAVTVFSRRDFVADAIQSALDQTVPTRVIVVEDCGPNPDLRDAVLRRFGSRIEYFRNPVNRGLFDNWNACMEYCKTPWLSILHDDDLLQPNFVESMQTLARQAPGRALYFGRSLELTEQGTLRPIGTETWTAWREIDPIRLADECFLMFPGQLFRVAAAQEAGGVRHRSFFTGDWDLWFRLALRGGGAQTADEVSIVRSHYGEDRGTSRVDRMGWKWALDNAQRKRNLLRLKSEKGIVVEFDRTKFLRQSPIPSRLLLRYAHRFSDRILAYNAWLFARSRPPHVGYALLQWLVRLFGPRTLRLFSRLRQRPR